LDVPQKYHLLSATGDVNAAIQLMSPEEQTLTDASVEFKDGRTVMKFTKALDEPNQIPINIGNNNMIWAYGSSPTIAYHANRSSFTLNLESGASVVGATPQMGAWLAHGICAFVAWGVLAPTAVQSALYRSFFNGNRWFKIHQVFNASAYAFTVFAFLIAVTITRKEGGSHFDTAHAKMGLAMLIIASVQVLGGAARPHLPDPGSGEEKTSLRKAWEFGHRLTGIILLACGFWQMSAGIKLFTRNFNGVGSRDERAVTIAYWVWIGFVMALLLIGGLYFKVLRKRNGEKNNAGKKKTEKKSKTEGLVTPSDWFTAL
jgi:hypothetical protein